MKRDKRMNGRNGTAAGIYKLNRQALDALEPIGIALNEIRRDSGMGKVFVGPTVEGIDKEYVKVLSGNVDRSRPSFA
jgi:hypothetical protein